MYEKQTSWKLEMRRADVAKAWRANYESTVEHVDYVRERFDAKVSEGLMLKLDEDAFWCRYGDEAALLAIAVQVDERPPEKKRVIHDASHKVIKCLVAPFLKDHAGRRGIVLSYAALAALNFPFKWAKTCDGFVVKWIGFETAYSSFELGLSQRRAEWLIRWCMEITSGRTTWFDFSCALERLGFGAKCAIQGAAVSWANVLMVGSYTGKHGSLMVPVMIRVILRWLAERFQKFGKVELTFFSDAKAENGKAYVGGYLWNGHEVLSWYAAEVLPSWTFWTFIKNDPQRTIASLELLGTLLCVKLWEVRVSGRSRSMGSITGATDNRATLMLSQS